MCYGSEVWGFDNSPNVERIELKLLKFILHLPSSAPNTAVRGELGQFPISLWWKERILKYWNKLCSENAPAITKAAMYSSLELAKPGKNSRAAQISRLYSFSEYFSEHYRCNQTLLNKIMCLYTGQLPQSWHADLHQDHVIHEQGGN